MNYFTVLHQHLMSPASDNRAARSTGDEFDAARLTPEMRAIARIEMRRAERIAAALVGLWSLLRRLAAPSDRSARPDQKAKPHARFRAPAAGLQK